MRTILLLILIVVSCQIEKEQESELACAVNWKGGNERNRNDYNELKEFIDFGSQVALGEEDYFLITWDKDARGHAHYGMCQEYLRKHSVLLGSYNGKYFLERIIVRNYECNHVIEYDRKEISRGRYEAIERELFASKIICASPLKFGDRVVLDSLAGPGRSDGYSLFFQKDCEVYDKEWIYLELDDEVNRSFSDFMSNHLPLTNKRLIIDKWIIDSTSKIQLILTPEYIFESITVNEESFSIEPIVSRLYDHHLTYQASFKVDPEANWSAENKLGGEMEAICFDGTVVKMKFGIYLSEEKSYMN